MKNFRKEVVKTVMVACQMFCAAAKAFWVGDSQVKKFLWEMTRLAVTYVMVVNTDPEIWEKVKLILPLI